MIFDSERKTFFKGMGFLTNGTVEYREKDQICMKMPRFTQDQAHLVCLYGCCFWGLVIPTRKARRVKTRKAYGSDLEEKFIPVVARNACILNVIFLTRYCTDSHWYSLLRFEILFPWPSNFESLRWLIWKEVGLAVILSYINACDYIL
jgi:hypothetical protein